MKIYISGPMTGYEDYNFPAFNEMANRLVATGNEPLNPANEEYIDRSRHFHMRKDIELVLQAEAIILLPGWKQSKGALLEVAIAKELELPILDGTTFERIDDQPAVYVSTLDEAKQLISADRQAEYGPPEKSFSNIATMWSIITGFPISAYTVALCMAALKLCRESNKPKRDNRVDAVAYIELADRLL